MRRSFATLNLDVAFHRPAEHPNGLCRAVAASCSGCHDVWQPRHGAQVTEVAGCMVPTPASQAPEELGVRGRNPAHPARNPCRRQRPEAEGRGGGAAGALASLRWRAEEESSRCVRSGSLARVCYFVLRCAALSVHAGGFGGQPGSLGSRQKGTRGPMAYPEGRLTPYGTASQARGRNPAGLFLAAPARPRMCACASPQRSPTRSRPKSILCAFRACD